MLPDPLHRLSLLNPIPAWQRELKGLNPTRLQQDLLSGITVGIVALPLALAFGVTSGAGAAAGLVTAIVAGLIASTFGGSRYQISGPTGAMTVVLLPLVAQYGLDKIFLVGLIAGLLVLTMGFLRLGRIVHLIPWPVVTGFTNGIALVIALQQLPAALGLPAPNGEGVLPATVLVLREYISTPNWTPLLALTTSLIMIFWPRLSKRIPGGIVALLLVTGASLVLQLDVPRIAAIPAGLPTPHFPSIQLTELTSLFGPALAVAVLAALESLLSAVVADGMSLGHRHDPDRELVGQGLANIAVSLFAGIPATGAIARTAVGVRSGGSSRLVGITHAIFLLLVVLFLGPLATRIPLGVLAGILFITAYRMFEFEAVKALARSTKSDFITMLLTMIITVGFDLILAIEIGLLVAGVLFVQRMINSLKLQPIDITQNAPKGLSHPELLQERVLAYRVEGPLFFGVAGRFLENLTALSDIDVVILRLRRVHTLDASGAHALEGIHRELNGQGITLLLSGLQPQPSQLLERMHLLPQLTLQGKHLFATTDEAIEHAWIHIQGRHIQPPYTQGKEGTSP